MTEFLDFSKGMFNQPGFLDLSAGGLIFYQSRRKKQDPTKTVLESDIIGENERLNEETIMGEL